MWAKDFREEGAEDGVGAIGGGWGEIQETGKDYIRKSCVLCIPHQKSCMFKVIK